MSQTPKPSKISALEAKNELWRRGSLAWKMHPIQREMHKIFTESKENSTLVWLLARQSGKSVLLAILALEQALRKPNSVIKLLTDTKVHIKSIFEPIFFARTLVSEISHLFTCYSYFLISFVKEAIWLYNGVVPPIPTKSGLQSATFFTISS